jgi:heptosyltransferase-2
MTDEAPRAPVVLVLAPNWLGDVVMTSPLLSRLAAARDRGGRRLRVALAVRRRWSALFADDPRVAAVVPVARTGRHGGIGGIVRLARDLRGVGADALVIGPPSLRAGLVARLAGIPVRVGHRQDGRGGLLTHALRRPERGRRHHSRELLDLGDAALAALEFAPDAAQEARWGLLPAWGPGRAAAIGNGPPVWVFAPGSTYGDAKVWPQARAAAFVGRAVGERGLRLALVGDGSARPFADWLRAETGAAWREDLAGPAGVVDLVGRTSVAELASLLLAAAAFVGNDSGVMHLAGALGVPTVGLFGSTNPDWTAPLGPATRVLAAAGFPCRPCYRRTCNQERFCLDTIGADAVFAAVAGVTGGDGKDGV